VESVRRERVRLGLTPAQTELETDVWHATASAKVRVSLVDNNAMHEDGGHAHVVHPCRSEAMVKVGLLYLFVAEPHPRALQSKEAAEAKAKLAALSNFGQIFGLRENEAAYMQALAVSDGKARLCHFHRRAAEPTITALAAPLVDGTRG
jgi:hypothetical protein